MKDNKTLLRGALARAKASFCIPPDSVSLARRGTAIHITSPVDVMTVELAKPTTGEAVAALQRHWETTGDLVPIWKDKND